MRFPDDQALTGSGDFERNAENPIWEINGLNKLVKVSSFRDERELFSDRYRAS